MMATAGAGVFRAVDVVWAQLRLGIMWWLACLPLVTAPAATIWLIHAVRRQAAGDVVPGGRAVARYVLATTFPALRLGLVHLTIAVYFVLTFNSAVPDGALGWALRALVVTAAITWLLILPWSFLLLERRGQGARDAIRASYLCALRRPGAAALTAAALLAGVMLLALVPAEITIVAALALPPVMVYLPLRCLATVQEKYLNA